MGFSVSDFPFVVRSDSRDPRSFPSHGEVLAYLQDFAKEFEIEEMIRFETTVVRVAPAKEESGNGGFESTEKEKKVGRDEIYDALVVCNGHYTEPLLAEIPGISSWPGKEMHSHNYRIPEPFKDLVVVRIGNAASAEDISRDIARAAKEVHVASGSNAADTYIKQAAPWLSFIGIAWKVVPFPMFELQSNWIAGALSGRITLPSEEDMMVEIETLYATHEAQGIPKRYTHHLGITQFEYKNWLASQFGCSGTEEWRKETYLTTGVRKRRIGKSSLCFSSLPRFLFV
ncbi:unnamed protein product [Arabis nemorensis]|uniref:Flavin-containing monooxygenase n=1 Tax=Arabis nemorensis TaxID=586526 RepID=A0A565BXE1_9BRAS|nr:unnamed protein product [Arabis nemorensis]